MAKCACKEKKTEQVPWALHDARGIFVAWVCDECEDKVRRRYNPWVFSGYDQSDVDERIEEEPY